MEFIQSEKLIRYIDASYNFIQNIENIKSNLIFPRKKRNNNTNFRWISTSITHQRAKQTRVTKENTVNTPCPSRVHPSNLRGVELEIGSGARSPFVPINHVASRLIPSSRNRGLLPPRSCIVMDRVWGTRWRKIVTKQKRSGERGEWQKGLRGGWILSCNVR